MATLRQQIRWQEMYPDSVADEDVIIPGKKAPDVHAEWRLQAACTKLIRAAMKHDMDLRFIAPGAEGLRDAKTRAIAQMMGRLERGVPDLWLLRRQGMGRLKIAVVEFKRPGGKLSPEQQHWFEWLPCESHRCDNVEEFKRILGAF